VFCICFGDCGRETGLDLVGLAICLKGDLAGLVGEVLIGLMAPRAVARVSGERGLARCAGEGAEFSFSC
jgi:hypothetical protein